MSVNSVNSTKKELFDVNTVVLQPKSTSNSYLNLINSKVSDIALKIIGGMMISLGSTIAIGSAVFLGLSVGVVPVVLVVSLIGVGVICLCIRSQFKRYYDKDSLKQYKQEAYEIYKSYEYLDKAEFIQGKEEDKKYIKSRILRPLKALIAKHDTLENLFAYDILKPNEFREAFDLEVKYLKFPESFALYEEVIKALDKVSKKSQLSERTPDKKEWEQRFFDYLNSVEPLFDDTNEPLKYDRMKESVKVLDEIVNIMEKLFKYGCLPQDKKEECEALKKKYLESKAKYTEATKESSASIAPFENIKAALDSKYQNHRHHQAIFKEQQEFLKGISAVQKEQERRLKLLDEDYKIIFNAILTRNDTDESHLQALPVDDLKLYEDFTKNYKKESDAIKKECECKLNVYMQANMSSGFTQMKEELKAYKKSLDESVPSAFQREKASFMQSHKESIQTFREEGVGFYAALLEIMEDSNAFDAAASG